MSESNKAIFLSYASQDTEAARRIADALRAAGVEVWFDQNELVGGDAWDHKIRRQIKECTLFVPVISANTQVRLEGYFRIEWKIAAQRTHAMAAAKAFLLPIVIDHTRDADAHVPEEFLSVQWTRFNQGEGTEAFCTRVKKLLGDDRGGRASSPPTRLEAGGTPALPDRGFRPGPAVVWTVGTLILATALAFWQPWKQTGSKPNTTVSEISEANRLVAKAWEQMDKTDMARSELLLAEGYCRQAAALEEANPTVWAAWSAMNTWYYFHEFERVPARREAARDYAQKALALDPKSYDARYAWAHFVVRMALRIGEERPALPILRELLRQRPDEPRALYALGFGLIADPVNADEGFATLERLAAKHPWFAGRALNEVGWMSLFHGRIGQAESAADRALQSQPYWNNLGLKATLALRVHGDLDLAQATIDRLPPTVLQENWGISLAVMVADWRGDHARAVAILETVSRDWLENFFYLGPTSFLSGQMRLKAKQVTAAEKDFRRALEVIAARLDKAPNDPALLYYKSEALRLLGMREEADKSYRHLREVWPTTLSQLTFELPEQALNYVRQKLQSGYKIDEFPPGWHFTAASLRLDPIFENARRAPGFSALVEAQQERERQMRAAAPAAQPPAKTSTSAPAALANEKSLVVLPLENLSPDPENAFFTDGMHAEVIATLQAVPELKVISREAAIALKRDGGSAAEMGRRAGVAHVLAGSVRREGTKVRVLLDLRRVSDDALLWSAPKVTRELKEALALQAEVAEEVARVLRARFDKGAFAGLRFLATDARAYDSYLKAYAQYQRSLNRPASILEAVTLMEEGMKFDPQFMPGARLLGRMYVRAYMIESTPEAKWRYASEAKRWSELASRLMPGGAGDSALAFYYASVEGDPARSLVYAENVVRALPNDFEGHHYIGQARMGLGRSADALPHFERSIGLDPQNSPSWSVLIDALATLRRSDDFHVWLEKCRQVNPQIFNRLDVAGMRFCLDGSLTETMIDEPTMRARVAWLWRSRRFEELVQRVVALPKPADPVNQNNLLRLLRMCDALRKLGRETEAMVVAREVAGVVEQMNALPERDPAARDRRSALALSRLGEAEPAMAAARRAVAARDGADVTGRWAQEELLAEIYAYVRRPRECCEVLARLLRVPSGLTVPMLKKDPTWDNVRNEPAFHALLADPKNSAPL